jgi:hypothetical protein
MGEAITFEERLQSLRGHGHILLMKGGSIILRYSLRRVGPRKDKPKRERHSGVPHSTAVLGGGPERGRSKRGPNECLASLGRTGDRKREIVAGRGGARPVKGFAGVRSSRIVDSHEGVRVGRGPCKEGNNESSSRSGAVGQLNASAYPQSKEVRGGIK